MSRYNNLISQIGKSPIFCSNLGFGEQGAILNKIGKAIYICPNIEKARQMKQQLDALNQSNVLIDEFSRPFTLSKFQSNQSKIDLLKAIYTLCFENTIVISTPNLLFSFLPNLKSFQENVLTLSKNIDYDITLPNWMYSNLGLEIAKGMIDSGVTPVYKHFPGIGDTNIDTHNDLPIINKTKEEKVINVENILEEFKDKTIIELKNGKKIIVNVSTPIIHNQLYRCSRLKETLAYRKIDKNSQN